MFLIILRHLTPYRLWPDPIKYVEMSFLFSLLHFFKCCHLWSTDGYCVDKVVFECLIMKSLATNIMGK